MIKQANGWYVFHSMDELLSKKNEARAAKDNVLLEEIENKSSLDLPGFRLRVERKDRSPLFFVEFITDDVEKSFDALLVFEDLIHLLSEFKNLVLSGQVAHGEIKFRLAEVNANNSIFYKFAGITTALSPAILQDNIRMRAETVQVFAPMMMLCCSNAAISRDIDIILHRVFAIFHKVSCET